MNSNKKGRSGNFGPKKTEAIPYEIKQQSLVSEDTASSIEYQAQDTETENHPEPVSEGATKPVTRPAEVQNRVDRGSSAPLRDESMDGIKRFTFSVFDSVAAEPKHADWSWDDLKSMVESPKIIAKKESGQALSAARFSGSGRTDKDVVELSSMVFDLDNGTELSEAKEALRSLDCAFAIHSTHSHHRVTKNNPNGVSKLRTIIPLKTPVPVAEYPRLWDTFKKSTGLEFDRTGRPPSHVFFSSQKASADAPYEYVVHEGQYLDWEALTSSSLVSEPKVAVAENNGFPRFEFHEDRHEELCRRIVASGRDTGRGTIEMKCPAHDGKGDTSLFHFLENGAVACFKGCSYFEILSGFGLPNGHFPKRNSIHRNAEPAPLPELSVIAPKLDPGLIPASLRDWIEDAAERLQCPLEYIVIPALIAVSAIIGNRIRVRPKVHDPWMVVVNLWGGIVGPPGVMKTPAVNEGMLFLRGLEQEHRDQFEEDCRRAEFSRKKIAAKRKQIEKKMEKATSDDEFKDLEVEYAALRFDEPKEKRISTSDVTVEKLGELLNENENGIMILRDELTGFLRMLEREGHEQDRAFYLEAWAGNGTFTFDRIARGTVHIRNMTVSLFGTIQPEKLEPFLRQATDGSGDDGLPQRFQLLVFPEPSKEYRYVDRGPKGRRLAQTTFYRLHDLEPEDVGARRETDESGGNWFIPFEPDAQEFFRDWLEDLERSLRSGTFDTVLESHMAKFRSLMPSLALIFHLIDRVSGNDSTEGISLENAKRAAAWCAYLRLHAEKLYAMASMSVFDRARAILAKIEAGELVSGFTARDVYGRHWKRLTKPEEVKEALDVLVDYGHLNAITLTGGGRPKTLYFPHDNVSCG